jgi:molybdate transport system substrate-binding protein
MLFLLTTTSFSQDIKVAAAANTQFAIKDLISTFEKNADFKVHPIIGSSGKLVAQINHGAPYHIFIAANMIYAEYLSQADQTIAPPIVYARGAGVLWTTRSDLDLSEGLGIVLSDDVQTIAIASPSNAPYGALAVKVLKEAGYYDLISDKLVFGSSVSQVNQYITLGTVDLGITAKSIAMSPSLRHLGNWIDIDQHSITQGMVMLKYSESNERKNTQVFYDFLQSEIARDIFKKYGYIVDEYD